VHGLLWNAHHLPKHVAIRPEGWQESASLTIDFSSKFDADAFFGFLSMVTASITAPTTTYVRHKATPVAALKPGYVTAVCF
jgi:hypothetical protein